MKDYYNDRSLRLDCLKMAVTIMQPVLAKGSTPAKTDDISVLAEKFYQFVVKDEE